MHELHKPDDADHHPRAKQVQKKCNVIHEGHGIGK
jgi:hypothetical protein